MCVYATTHVCRSANNFLGLVITFNYVGSGHPSQIVTPSNKNQPLSTEPHPVFWVRVSKSFKGSLGIHFPVIKAGAMLLPFFQDCFNEQGGGCFMTHSFTPRSLEVWAHYDWLRCQIQCWEVSNTDPLSFSASSLSRVHIHAQHRHSTPLTLFLLTFTFPRWMKPWPHLLGIP